MEKEKREDIDRLVELAKAGDSDAFALIYDELVKPVYRYVFYRVESVIAEDITEETFFRAWQNLKKYKKGKQPFSAWIFRIAHNLVVDHYRRNKTTEMIDEAYADTKEDRDPRKTADVKLTQIRLRKLIRKLPDNYREIIILKYINELDNREISEVTGKSEGAIRTLQSRALSQMREMCGDEF